MSSTPILLFVLVAAAIYLYTSSSSSKKDSTPPSSDSTPEPSIPENLLGPGIEPATPGKIPWSGSHLYELDSDVINLLNSFLFESKLSLDQTDLYVDKDLAKTFINYYKVKNVKMFFSSTGMVISEVTFVSGMSVNGCVSLNDTSVQKALSDHEPTMSIIPFQNIKGNIGDAEIIIPTSTGEIGRTKKQFPVIKFKKVSGSLSCAVNNGLTIRCPSKSCPSGSSVKNPTFSFDPKMMNNMTEEQSINLFKDMFATVMSKCGCVINNNSTNPFYNKKLKDTDNNEYDIGQTLNMYHLPTGTDECEVSESTTFSWYEDDSSTILVGLKIGGKSPIFRYKAGNITDVIDTRNTVRLVNNITANNCKPEVIGACSIM